MKKITLLTIGLAFSFGVFANPTVPPPTKDISSILQLNASFSLGKDLVGENGLKGCVADFNADGIDDFIVTGLYVFDDTVDPKVQKGFMRVYLGQKTGAPLLAYNDEDFKVVGNGAIDCHKMENGAYLVALQGGAVGNWSNPFKGQVYHLTADGTNVSFEFKGDLDYGGGRNSILLLDMDNDGYADIFQGGWASSGSWGAKTNIYINAGDDEWFDFVSYGAGEEPIRVANNTYVTKGDLNNDGKIDLLQPIQKVGLFAYFNNGDGTFEEVLVTPFTKEDRTDGMNLRGEEDGAQAQMIDFDGDGLLDIVLMDTNDNTGGDWTFVLLLFKNNGDKTFTQIDQTDFNELPTTLVGGQRGDFAVGDFNLDGHMDLIIGGENQYKEEPRWGCRTYLLLGNGKGGFEQSEITFTEDTNPTGVIAMSRRANFGAYLVGDFNGDGKKDLVTAGGNYYGKNADLRIYFNVATGGASIGDEAEETAVIYAQGNLVNIDGATIGAEISVYNLSGVQVYKNNVTSAKEQITLATPGMYIVKAGSAVQKVMIN